MEEKTFKVVELNSIIKRVFDMEEMLHGILVEGEVTNFKISGSHGYFNLKDKEAQIFCTFFNITRSSVDIPKNGDQVVVRGTPDFYVKGGSLSLKVTKMTPAGLGALYLKFLELKEKLEKEGLFLQEHKKPLPPHPKRIGVITSRTGAVIQDIINVTTRRNPFCDIVLFPCKVQGENAEIEIARAVERLDRENIVDVIIVGRGGGSMEDLMCFNTEIVARAVYNCKTPIISAVGHETDFSLCDFASDMRAPTPSAAAEIASPDIVSSIRNFKNLAEIMQRKSMEIVKNSTEKMKNNISTLKYLGDSKISKGENKIMTDTNQMLNLIRNIYIEKRNTLKLASTKIDSLSPMKMLEKGFSRVTKDGVSLKSTKSVKVGDVITTHLLDGEVQSKVVDLVLKEK